MKDSMNKTRFFMMLAAVLCCTLSIRAQEVRNQVYKITLGNVQYAHHNEKMTAGEAIGQVLAGVLTGQTSLQATEYEEDAKNAIIKGLSHAYRFRFNDGLPQIGETEQEGNLVVDAVITNIQSKSSTRTWKDRDGKTQMSTTYTGIAEAMLNVKDARTGEVIANPTMGGWGSGSSSFSTSDQAIKDALGRLSNRITVWLNKYRPLHANIIEGNSFKKDKQKEVYIDLGTDEGAYVGLYMGVYITKIVAGREANQQIGKLRITAVEGKDISLCKVVNGGKDIKQAIDSGQQLKVLTIDN